MIVCFIILEHNNVLIKLILLSINVKKFKYELKLYFNLINMKGEEELKESEKKGYCFFELPDELLCEVDSCCMDRAEFIVNAIEEKIKNYC